METMPALIKIWSQFLRTQWRAIISEWARLRLGTPSYRGWQEYILVIRTSVHMIAATTGDIFSVKLMLLDIFYFWLLRLVFVLGFYLGRRYVYFVIINHGERVLILLRESDDVTACHFGCNIDRGSIGVKQTSCVYNHWRYMLDMFRQNAMWVRDWCWDTLLLR